MFIIIERNKNSQYNEKNLYKKYDTLFTHTDTHNRNEWEINSRRRNESSMLS